MLFRSVLGAFGALWVFPRLFKVSALTATMGSYLLVAFVVLAFLLVLLFQIKRSIEKRRTQDSVKKQ